LNQTTDKDPATLAQVVALRQAQLGTEQSIRTVGRATVAW